MGSVEGLWLLRTTQNDSDELVSPSVITLETGRLFGGDSAFFYVGDYRVEHGKISGTALVRTHTLTPDLENVFGVAGPVEHTVSFVGNVTDNLLEGTMKSGLQPDLLLKWQMQKLAELP